MKAGQTIKAKTHAELLNVLLKTNYKQWYKCTYDLDDKTFIWMVCLDSTNNEGHRNMFENSDTIIEQFDKDMIKNKRFYHGLERKYRLVFEKKETKKGRTYTFHGFYHLADTSEDEYKRTLKKISDKYNF